MIQPLLTILIPTITERRAIRHKLVDNLRQQIDNGYVDKVELLISEDDRTEVYGNKMNRMINEAKGKYISNIDDDDLVCNCYIEDILEVLTSKPNSDVVTFKLLKVDTSLIFDSKFYNLRDLEPRPNLPNGISQLASHLSVWRREIARLVKFPNVTFKQSVRRYGMGPEVRWYFDMKEKWGDKGLNEVHIDKILYLYFYDPLVTTSIS